MTEQLSSYWLTFRSRKKSELVSEGTPKHTAQTLADREARARQFTEQLAGREAALTAKLITDYRSDGTYSTYAAVNPEVIPPHLSGGARAWSQGRFRAAIH